MKWFKNIFSFFKKRKKLTIVLVLVILVLGFILRPKPPVPPETMTVKKTDITQSVSVSGTVNAERKADLSFPSYGKITYIGAKKSDMVKQYQTIAAVDARTLQKNIENAVKQYQSQQIQFDIVNDFNGDRAITDTGLSTSAFRQLKTSLNSLDETKIAVEIQKIAAEQSYLVAPFNGILTRADVDTVGANVGASNLYTIIDPSSMVFSMDVDEADIGKVQPGQTVKISLDAYPNDTIVLPINRIDFSSHTTSSGGNVFTTEVALATSSAQTYRIGMNGNAEIITGERKNVLTIPLSSIFDTDKVYVKTKNGYAKRKVVLGLSNDIDGEVLSGVSEGDVVVTQPNLVPPQK